MLDAVVTLRPVGAVARLAGEKPGRDSNDDAAAEVVRIRLTVRAPERACDLKLWDAQGRNPKLLIPEAVHSQPDFDEIVWRPDYSIYDLDGQTVTWSVRLASPRPDSFELRVEVLLNDAPLPDGRFVYSGLLEAAEIEERTGRFHFKVEG